MPERPSPAFSVTFTGPAYQPLSSGSGSSDEVTGCVRSILIPPAVVFAVFPALSLIDSLAERLSPSPLTVLSAGQLPSTPESASEQFQPMITSPAYQPAAFGSVVGVPLRVGAVLSTLMRLTPPCFELPAASTADPFAD